MSEPCGKRCFASVRAAREANRKNSHSLHPYFCKGCRAYHMAKRDAARGRFLDAQ
jgi:hypothetical protein